MWQACSIWGSNCSFVGALLPWLVIGSLFAMKRHRLLDILQLGDETAISVGIAVKKRTNRFVAVSGDVGGISDFRYRGN